MKKALHENTVEAIRLDTARRLSAFDVVGALADPPLPPRSEAVPTDALRGDDPLLSTFGLIGPGKGLEDAIAALSAVVPHVPGVRYIIAGSTHPEEARDRGEAYREDLRRIAARCGVAERVYQLDEFLTTPVR